MAEEEPRQKQGGKRKGTRGRRGLECRGRKLENDGCGVREGVGDTSVCISAAKLPFEAGGKEETVRGKKRAAGGATVRKRGKGERKERQRDSSGEEEEWTVAAAAAEATTARLNANSFIDWNSKSSSFDSCNHLLHPFSPLLSSPSIPRSTFPSARRVSTSSLSSPTSVSRFPSLVPLRFSMFPRPFIKPRVPVRAAFT